MTTLPETAPEERWQHGAVQEQGDTGRQSISRPVAALRRTGKIGDAEVNAAERYYRDYALGLGGVREQDWLGVGGSSGSSDGFAAVQLDALGAYRGASTALGPVGAALLDAVILSDMTLTAIAMRSGRSVTFMAGQVAAFLSMLAAHYAAADGARPAPVANGRIRAVYVSDQDT